MTVLFPPNAGALEIEGYDMLDEHDDSYNEGRAVMDMVNEGNPNCGDLDENASLN
jgi:hypothetical protein